MSGEGSGSGIGRYIYGPAFSLWCKAVPLTGAAAPEAPEWFAALSAADRRRLRDTDSLRAIPGEEALVAKLLAAKGHMLEVCGVAVIARDALGPRIVGKDGFVLLGCRKKSRVHTRSALIAANISLGLRFVGRWVTEAKDIDWLCAATSIGGLSGVQLPRVLRRIVLASAVDDATFSDETIMAHAAARLRQEGRSVEVTIIGGDDER